MDRKEDIVEVSKKLNTKVVLLTGSGPKLTGSTLTEAIMLHAAKADVSADPYWVQKQRQKRLRPKR